jgi:hypothetical protein
VGGLYFALSKFIAVANQTSVLLAGRAQKDDERASLICGLQRLMMPRKPYDN